MKKPMLVAFSILLMLFAFVACQGNPTEIPEEQIEAENLAEDYLSSIRYADVLYKVFEGETGIELKASTANSITVSFKDYTGEAVKKTGDIEGIKSGVLEYTFNEPSAKTLSDKSYTIKTGDDEPLVFMLKEGATAETTISFTISGSCKIDLQITSDKITGIGAGASFGKIESGTITVGEGEDAIEVDPDNVNITIDNEATTEEPEAKIYKLTESKNYSEIKDELAEYDGIEGNGKNGSVVLTINDVMTLTDDFSFKSIVLDGNRSTVNYDKNKKGIDIEAGNSNVTITITDSTVRNFGIAFFSDNIGTNNQQENGLLTLKISGSDFSNCYKGLYVTNLYDLDVDTSSFVDMGADSVSTSTGSSTTEDKMNRSGSAFDINQMVAGNNIEITGSDFKDCGAQKGTTGTTSGAIKVKVRGGENEEGPDIPDWAAGSFKKFVVENCTFSGNRKDIVLGTDDNVSSADFPFTYTGTAFPAVEDNARQMLVIAKDTDYSVIKDEIANYTGIRGTSDKPVVKIGNTPITLAKSFTFESITLDGGVTGEPDPQETPMGIDLSSSRDNITITIKDSVIKNFGYAITSNKANGSGETGTVNSGSLTLNIEDADFSNCYKGLYATDIKNLTVKGGSYTDMGAASTVDGNNVVKRSGAAFDINQMSDGESITFTDVTFTRCGGTGEADELTSGAIKVKVRGGEGDTKPDIPYSAADGKLNSLTIEGCTFTDNRMDVVLGTSNIASTDDFNFDNIQETGCDVENNAAPEKS